MRVTHPTNLIFVDQPLLYYQVKGIIYQTPNDIITSVFLLLNLIYIHMFQNRYKTIK
jgi:hypothetical protein